MKTLFSSAYLAPIEYYAHWLQAENPVMDIHENYRKQTFRSRTYIAGANGALTLNIPIAHPSQGGAGHQKMAQARTVTEFRWERQHFRSLETAYRTSPFFEYYEDRFKELYFSGETDNLLSFNLRAHRLICGLLGADTDTAVSQAYQADPQDTLDLREAFSPKRAGDTVFPPYTQVFDDRLGFLPNLSIVDLLFCCGPQAAEYLKNIKLSAL